VFRKKAQMFKNTTFIFAGSRRHVMNDIFSNAEKPFYRFSKVYNLEPLGKSETIGFLRHKFNSTIEEVQIDSDLLERIYEVSNGHPYYVQYMSHMMWNIAVESGKLELEDVERATNKVLQSERSMYEMLWDSLSSNQKAALKNIAYDISPYELNMSAGSVKTALDKLVKMDVIQKGEKRYELVDPFLGMWMKMERVVLLKVGVIDSTPADTPKFEELLGDDGFINIFDKIVPLILLPVVMRLLPDTSVFGIFDMYNVIASFAIRWPSWTCTMQCLRSSLKRMINMLSQALSCCTYLNMLISS